MLKTYGPDKLKIHHVTNEGNNSLHYAGAVKLRGVYNTLRKEYHVEDMLENSHNRLPIQKFGDKRPDKGKWK
jgi:hypothetical protein